MMQKTREYLTIRGDARRSEDVYRNFGFRLIAAGLEEKE